ncbi:nitrite reductase [Paenibacillus sp. HJGM_3]|uniref:nitrite reductase n=1 Tax=Paenibacillus sp. HJGM_3 TaxID=3379816 RepID=UPI00385EA472
MGESFKLAVVPPIQVGGRLFTPEQLMRIAAVAGTGARIEMTTFNQLYVEVPPERHETIQYELEQAGLSVYQAGIGTKSLIACPFCRGAEEAGLETARALNEAIAGLESPTPLKIGYAGCALGTSEPLLKDIGVVKMRDVYDLYVGGEPKGLKATLAVLFASGIPEDRLIPTVLAIIRFYQTNAKGKEKFSRFVHRVTLEQLQAAAGLT